MYLAYADPEIVLVSIGKGKGGLTNVRRQIF